MQKIPIHFEFEEKEFSGYFNPVSGSANTTLFHLMISNYYKGQLFYTNSWQFFGTNFTGMGDFFGNYVTAWHESNS